MAMLVIQPSSAAGQSTGRPPPDSYDEIIRWARELLVEIAFDPERFFREERFGQNLINISYTGDSEAWPVYSIAIRRGCARYLPASRDCPNRRTARMVRAPAVPDPSRPRMRGWNLATRVIRSGAATPEAVASELGRAGVEWLEADLGSCPAASALVSGADRIAWVPEEIYAPRDPFGSAPRIHADRIEVTFATSRGRSTHSGVIDEGTPSAWAAQLAEALEPCWRSLEIPPPWQR